MGNFLTSKKIYPGALPNTINSHSPIYNSQETVHHKNLVKSIEYSVNNVLNDILILSQEEIIRQILNDNILKNET